MRRLIESGLWLPLLCCVLCACVKLDFFLFDSYDADLDDYDFTAPELDGIHPSRITSTLIQSADLDEQIHIVYVERDTTKLDPRIPEDEKVTVLFSHGNRGNILLYWYRAGYFEDMGFNVLFYDYRGYGASDGEASSDNVYEDARTAFEYLRGRDDVGSIISAGYSMGGAPALYLCNPENGKDPAGCFTEAAFSDTDDLLHEATGYHVPGSWVMDAHFDNLAQASKMEVPYLLMHGTADDRIGFGHAQRLWEAAGERHPLNRFFPVGGAGHRNVPVPSYPGTDEPKQYSHPDELPPYLHDEFLNYKERIVDFVAQLVAWD